MVFACGCARRPSRNTAARQTDLGEAGPGGGCHSRGRARPMLQRPNSALVAAVARVLRHRSSALPAGL